MFCLSQDPVFVCASYGSYVLQGKAVCVCVCVCVCLCVYVFVCAPSIKDRISTFAWSFHESAFRQTLPPNIANLKSLEISFFQNCLYWDYSMFVVFAVEFSRSLEPENYRSTFGRYEKNQTYQVPTSSAIVAIRMLHRPWSHS